MSAQHSALSTQHSLAGEYDNMLACVRCGLCLTSCPTYVLTGHEAEGPRGRVAMMRALAEGRLDPTPDLVHHEQNCLVCDACTAVCPCGVRMDPLQVALRSAIAPVAPRSVPEWVLRRLVFRGLFMDPRWLRLLARSVWLYQRLGLQRLARRTGLLRLLRAERLDALLPVVPRDFIVPRGELYPAHRPENPPTSAGVEAAPRERAAPNTTQHSALSTQHSPPERVALFAGCVMSTGLAEIDRATIRVLRRAGYDVVNPAGQGCCGALHAHGGDLDGALVLARRNVAAFADDGQAPIVVNSAGCGAMLKDYGHHLRSEPAWAARAAAFAARVRDVTEFLAIRPLWPPQPPNPGGSERPRPHSALSTQHSALVVTYQDACHLAHAQRIIQPPRTLLRAIPGLELREMAERSLCCGSAGVYNVTNPRESRALRERRLDQALATGADVIATANPGCLLQLRAGLAERGSRVQVRHVVELLDDATGPGARDA
jgi:glycolate oxidase iron-sulfur subunit